MLRKKARRIVVVLAWLFVLVVAPYTTAVILKFNPMVDAGLPLSRYGFVSVGSLMLAGAIILLALWCTKLNDDIESLSSHLTTINNSKSNKSEVKNNESFSNNEKNVGLKLLRMASSSPLRGTIPEKSVIVSVNGHAPSTAAEANRLLVIGTNEIEWVELNGRRQSSTFLARRQDLKAQFEQIQRK